MFYTMADFEVEALMRERKAAISDPSVLQREEEIRHRRANPRRSRRAHAEERVLTGEVPADDQQKRISEEVYGDNLLRASLLIRR